MNKVLILSCFSIQILVAQSKHICAVSKISSYQATAIVSQAHRDLENCYDVKFHHFDIKVERTNHNIAGNLRTLSKVVSTTLDTFAFELHSDLILDSVVLGTTNLTCFRSIHEVRALLPSTFVFGNFIDLKIYWHGTSPVSGMSAIGNGFSNGTSNTWGNQCTWSLSESYVADEWWPCKQSLQDKIDSVYMWVTTDSLNKVGSNGLLKNVTNMGNGKVRFEWKEKSPIDYYLISVAVAKYVEYNVYAHPTGLSDSILVQNYIYNNPATLTSFKPQLDEVPSFIELFSDLFGLYPFAAEKYGHCMAPFGGGMEHQTMTSVGFFDQSVDAHELGHQWWGDNVTCSTWNDIWINEGWATYCEYLYRQYLYPTQALAQMNSVHTNVLSLPDGSVWCSDTSDVNRIFDSRLSYDKGAAIIHTFRFETNNDTIFFNTCKNFQQNFGGSTASGLNFKQTLENLSGLSFTQSFNQWYFGEGYPTFTVKWNQLGNNFLMKSDQTVSMAAVTPLFITDIEYKIKRLLPYLDTVVRVNHALVTEWYNFNIPGTVTSVVIDPNQWILNKGTATKDLSLVSIDRLGSLADVKIFPNPAKDFISFQSNTNMAQYEVVNINGVKIFTDKITSSTTCFSLVDFSNGIYFLILKEKNGSVFGRTKFVVER